MLRIVIFFVVLAALCTPQLTQADESIYRANTKRFIKLFNEHDAESLAQEYAADCSVINTGETVEKFESRKEVAKALVDFFATHPNVRIDLPLDKVDYRTLSGDTVIESGEFVLLGLSEDDGSAPAMYTTVYERDSDSWKIVYERTWPKAGTGESDQQRAIGQQKMQVFGDLIGRWEGVKADGTAADPAVYRWINNKSYIELVVGDYREIMGWDIKRQQYVSWAFGTHGGQGVFVWRNDGEGQWSWTSDQWCDRSGVDAVLTGRIQFDEETLRLAYRYGDNPEQRLALSKVPTE